jgi:hypothetical protein
MLISTFLTLPVSRVWSAAATSPGKVADEDTTAAMPSWVAMSAAQIAASSRGKIGERF